LAKCQIKCLGLEQDVANQQKTLKKAILRATTVEKERLNSMEDIEHYHQTMLDMKEKY
jgi:hypothetical protein